jgi:hypothetical protein
MWLVRRECCKGAEVYTRGETSNNGAFVLLRIYQRSERRSNDGTDEFQRIHCIAPQLEPLVEMQKRSSREL